MNRSSLLVTLVALGSATSAVLIASCLPEPHTLVGRPCDAEHGCEDAELTCCLGTCQPLSEVAACEGAGGTDGGLGDGGPTDGGTGMDGGSAQDAGCPPNLLAAGGFEQPADVLDYSNTGAGLLSRTTTRVRTGTGALQVMKDPSDSQDFFGASLDEELLASKVRLGPNYCMAAWMNRGDVFGELRLYPRRFSSSSYDGIIDGRGDKQVLTDDGWHLFLYDITLTATYNRSINLRTSANTSAGSVYFVDDVRVWESPDGGCEARCAP